MADNIIDIQNITIEFPLSFGTIRAVNNVSFQLPRNTISALVGESGSGKTTLASALLRIVSSPGYIKEGKVLYDGQDILKYDNEQLRKYKWAEVAMVFQAAQNALNPLMTIQEQMLETFRVHGHQIADGKCLQKARELLNYVRLDADRVLKCYPHELSGGMKQRVMIAFALLLDPKVLILDEPTTALDVITQDYIFDILQKIYKEFNITMLLMTHDIAVVARFAQKMSVMYAGHIVESSSMFDIFKNSQHEYTRQLIKAAPTLIDDLSEREAIIGTPPNLLDPPKGCAFYPRCQNSLSQCETVRPLTYAYKPQHFVQCNKFADCAPAQFSADDSYDSQKALMKGDKSDA